VIDEARSYSHRWVVEPDRSVDRGGGQIEIIEGHVIRVRLTTQIKPTWRPARWDELDPIDPATAEAWKWKRDREQAEARAAGKTETVTVYRDGVPERTQRPKAEPAPTPSPAEPAAPAELEWDDPAPLPAEPALIEVDDG
jgi:hypothetical protein